jgi:hypothetical protein
MVLNVQDDWKESSSGHKECMRYGPVLPQTARLDSGELEKVLDPVHVQGRGAPKKRLKKKRKRSNSKCGYCRLEGHNRRKCAKWIEVVNQTKVDFCMWLTCEYSERNKNFVSCAGQQSDRALLALFTWPSAPAWPPCRPPPPSTTSLSRSAAPLSTKSDQRVKCQFCYRSVGLSC